MEIMGIASYHMTQHPSILLVSLLKLQKVAQLAPRALFDSPFASVEKQQASKSVCKVEAPKVIL